jgi:hypothetical protein
MIIGVGGKMGSGKNTVCEIIQGLCATNNGPAFEQKAFAGKLKETASLLTGIPVEKFEDQEFKKTSLGSEWNRLLYATLDDENPLLSVMSVRELLQKLGTEAMRDGLHVNVWINALFADYKPTDSNWNDSLLKHKPENMLYPNWIITDMRFPNEMEAVVEKGGLTIKVTRPVEKRKTTARLHPSETALDDAKFDYEIINDGTIEDLVEKVREILTKEAII